MTFYQSNGGDLSDPNNYTPTGVPNSPTDVVSGGGTLSGASLNIGQLLADGPSNLNIGQGGMLTLNGVGGLGGQFDCQVTVTGGTINCSTASISIGVGTGAFSGSSGASITSAEVLVGSNQSGNGSITLDGTGTNWMVVEASGLLDNGGFVDIGLDGTGILTVQNGATFKSQHSLHLGTQTTGSGTATFMGTGTIGSCGVLLAVGNAGQGTFTVRDGAQFKVLDNPDLESLGSGDLQAGNMATGTGTIIIRDSGTIFSIAGTSTIGVSGTGSLQVFGGATATLNNVVVAQNATSGTGFGTDNPMPSALEVSGTGSDLTATSLVVGQGGYASFDVMKGATAEVTNLTAGVNSGSQSTIFVQGANLGADEPNATSKPNLNVDGTLAAGVNGTCNLSVTDAGKLYASTLSLGGGDQGSGIGTLYVDTFGYVQVNGDMTVEGANGSSVSDSGGIITVNGDLDLGGQAGSKVTMTVQGGLVQLPNNSDVQVEGNLTLGVGSDLNISQGGSLEWGGTVTIGDGTTANQGGVLIANGGTMTPMMGSSGGSLIDKGGFVTVGPDSTLTTANMTVGPVGFGGDNGAIVDADGGIITIAGGLTIQGSPLNVMVTIANNLGGPASDAEGTIEVKGGSDIPVLAPTSPPSAGTFQIDASGLVSGSGYIGGGAIVDNGLIEATASIFGNTLDALSDISGNGVLQIDGFATLAVAGVAKTITTTFNGLNATLDILEPTNFPSLNGAFQATIGGFVLSDKIVLYDAQVGDLSEVANGGQTFVSADLGGVLAGANLLFVFNQTFPGLNFDTTSSSTGTDIFLESSLVPYVKSVLPLNLGHAFSELNNIDISTATTSVLDFAMSAAVIVVDGTPTLSFNDGGTAVYDAANSTATTLAFDYTAGPNGVTTFGITSINLNGATIRDSNGDNADLSSLIGLPIATTALDATQVDDIYLAVLQRHASGMEIGNWIAQVNAVGNEAAVANIVGLPEAQFNVYPIIQIIQLATGELPTAAQLAGWVPFIEQDGPLQGQSQTNPLLDQMAEAFVASDNFAKTYNPPFTGTDVDPSSPVTAQEMQIIIKAATGIAATQMQVNAWLSLGLTIDQVFVDFALGDQYTAFSQAGNQQYLTTVADAAAVIQASASIVGSAAASSVAHAA